MMFRLYRRFLLLGVLLAVYTAALDSLAADDPAAVLPEIPRDETIQTPAQYFGFPIGSRHLRHDQLTSYFRYLDQQSDRVSWVPYGETFGKRPLYVLAITSPENQGRLPQIRTGRKRLVSGWDPAPEALAAQSLVMWLGYGVHGDEASTVNAAPLVAYHLASAQSPEAVAALEQCVFLLDPALNPDGVDRFANWVNDNRGRFASAENVDREHQQPWPGGRSNYYWFDLNRDWLPVVQPESQGRMRLFHQWKPNVVLDYHEMGGSATYFFQPGIPTRNNPLSPAENLRLTQRFAKGFAEVMDQANERYYTEESFDDFYIGKGSTYPDLNGSVGILFEQGSTRGLRLKSESTERHFRQTVANQIRTTLSAIQSAVEFKTDLLKFQVDFYRQALQAAAADSTQAFVLTGSKSRVLEAHRLLRRHAISGHISHTVIQVDGIEYGPGQVLVIPSRQPQYTLLRSLMETPQSFTENVFYDVSAWHLPSAMDLQLRLWQSDLPAQWLTDSAADPAAVESSQLADREATELLGFAFSPTELESATWVARLMQMDVQVQVSLQPFSADSTQEPALPSGTFVVLKSLNPTKWKSIVAAMRRWEKNGATAVVPLEQGLNPFGPDLGSGQLRVLPPCRPALVVGDGTTSTVAGALWHYLDQRLEQPATLLDAPRLSRTRLVDYSCLILPTGSYADWGKAEVEALTQYAEQGGTIVAIGSAAVWLQRQGLTMSHPDPLPASREAVDAANPTPAAEPQGGDSPALSTGFADAADVAALERIAGAFFSATIDPTHPLGFGFPDHAVPVFRDSTTSFGRPTNPYQMVASYEKVIAGYVSSRNRQRLAGSAAVWVQNVRAGRIVVLADNPVFRGYTRSSERFLSNAVLLGPIVNVPRAGDPD
jgi:hypothetical protein